MAGSAASADHPGDDDHRPAHDQHVATDRSSDDRTRVGCVEDRLPSVTAVPPRCAGGNPRARSRRGRGGAGAKELALSRLYLIACALAMSLVLGTAGAVAKQRTRPSIPTAHLTIHYSRFTPADLHLPPGPVIVLVHNTDPIGHELIIGDSAVQDLHERGTDAHHDGPGEMTVPPGAVVRVHYTMRSTTLFGCHLPGHYAYGMRGRMILAFVG
jgi:uncharacterized cupredoxin-like copper-binding protein